MKSIFRIEMLPAQHGDCLWIEYGDAASPSRVLIDAGPAGAWKYLAKRLAALPVQRRRFELLVCTHVDADHITGVLKLLSENQHDVRYADVWFNGWRQMTDAVAFGPAQGERLSAILQTRPWNQAFGGEAIVLPEEGAPPQAQLPGGLTLTVLSPTIQKLHNFVPKWEKECRKAGLDPDHPAEPQEPPPVSFAPPAALDIDVAADSRFQEDGAEANGSSIAVLAEFDGRRVLFGADAHPSVLLAALKRLQPAGRVRLDAFKLPHHGSRNNVSRALIEKVDARRYLVSTNGDIFQHPDVAALARVVKYGGSPDLIFNYRTQFNAMWDAPELRAQWGYRTTYPAANRDAGGDAGGDAGVIVDLTL